MNWSLDIERTDNGYIASWWEDWEGVDDDGKLDKMVQHRMVFEEEDVGTGELDCMVNLLYFVKEHFGIYGSKHDKHRINIEVQDRHEDDNG